MSVQQTVVNYRQILKALDGRYDALEMEADEGLESVAAPAAGAKTRMLSELSHALSELEAAERKGGVMVVSQDRTASLLQSYLAKRATDAGQLDPAGAGVLEAKFDERDIIGWVGSFFTWWKRLRPHRLVTAAPDPEPMPNNARVALLADWGTGLYGAPVSAKSIQEDTGKYHVLMHLGDIYYSGDDDEVRDRFLRFWPKVDGAVSRALNANHEMYTGGRAYFQIALKQFGQKASYFALQNDHWILVGLDSAHRDHDLAGKQVEWLENIARRAGDRRILLFSHHQPISLFERQGPNLTSKLAALLDERRIFGWYWGHEHRCVLYDKHPLWRMWGRCIGNGGFPYFRDEQLGPAPSGPEWKRVDGKNMVPGGVVLDGPNPYVEGHENEYGPNGYVTLEFQDGRVHEVVRDPDGTRRHEQELV